MKAIEKGYFDVLHEAAKAVNSSLSSEQVLETIVRVAATATGAKGCSLMLLDDALTYLVHIATYGLSDQFLSKGVISADRIMIETTGGKPVVVSDVSNDPRIQYPQETMKEGIYSELSVPLYLRDRITGVLRIYSGKRQEFSEYADRTPRWIRIPKSE